MSQHKIGDEFMSFDSFFPKRVATARATVGLTQSELAGLAGVVQRQVAAYEGGEAKPREKTLKRLAAALGTTPEWLESGKGEPPSLDAYIPAINLNQVPLISPEFVPRWLSKKDLKTHKLHPCKINVSEFSFAVQIHDDSMSNGNSNGITFPAGAIVTFDPEKKVKNKDFAMAIMENGYAIFKQVFMTPRQESISLSSIDNRYPALIFSQEDIEIGKLTLIKAVYLDFKLD